MQNGSKQHYIIKDHGVSGIRGIAMQHQPFHLTDATNYPTSSLTGHNYKCSTCW